MNMMHCYPEPTGSKILRQYFSVTTSCYHNAPARRGRSYLKDLRFNFLRKHVAGRVSSRGVRFQFPRREDISLCAPLVSLNFSSLPAFAAVHTR